MPDAFVCEAVPMPQGRGNNGSLGAGSMSQRSRPLDPITRRGAAAAGAGVEKAGRGQNHGLRERRLR